MEIKMDLKTRIIDSLKSLQMKLSKFSNVSGLKETKEWFPHKFNKTENWNYVGSYHESEYYGVSMMGNI